jgi:Mg2+ and Co2+ transporter CorA
MENFRQRPDPDEHERPDPKKNWRKLVYLVLPDGLMIVLAGVLIPVVLVPLFIELPESIDASFKFADYTIYAVFILEYLLKAALAPNIIKHVLDPWHLLDLFVVVVPLVNFLPMISSRFVTSSPLLRLLRIIRVVALGGRAVDRRMKLAPLYLQTEVQKRHMEVQVIDEELGNNYQEIEFSNVQDYLSRPSQTWVDISCVSEEDYDRLSESLDIPRIILESELVEDSYPRLDYFEHYSIMFARIADVQISKKGPSRLIVNRSGLLIICQGSNIITLSKKKTDLFSQILDKARVIHGLQEPLAVTILYTILKYIIERDRQIISILEQELINMEDTPPREAPDNFLETTFFLRKEVNQLVPALLHLKEIILLITSKRVPLIGFNERHEKIFDILMDEAAYLHETASNARDSLLSLIDLYINTTSYETNKVMRVIAVITSLGIIPAIMGLLGSNILGNPWNIHLWQVFSVLGVLMVALGWIFYRLGWLKG